MTKSDEVSREVTLLYEGVGRCLSAWNAIENELLRVLEYAQSPDGEISLYETALAYWSVVSFEARLKSVDAVVRFRLRFEDAPYPDLMEQWNAINNTLTRKARKRAEVAHGSVVVLFDGKRRIPALVPALERQRLKWNVSGMKYQESTAFTDHIERLTSIMLGERSESFFLAQGKIRDFLDAWKGADKSSGFVPRYDQ